MTPLSITVTEAIQHPEVSLMDRQRLKNWQASLYERIDEVQAIRLSSDHQKGASPKKGRSDKRTEGKPL